MKTVIVAASLFIAAAGAAFMPTSAQAQVNFNIVIGNPPPPPRYEVIPGPRAGYVWAPGYWNWDGRRHDWRAGHWERVRAGQVYSRPQWVQADNGWRLQEGGWRHAQGERYERYERHERHDRDERYQRRDRDERHDHDDHRGDDHGRHGEGHCPPGQAKKGNC